MLRILEWAERFEGEKIDTALLDRAIQGTAMDGDMPDVKPGMLDHVNGAILGRPIKLRIVGGRRRLQDS